MLNVFKTQFFFGFFFLILKKRKNALTDICKRENEKIESNEKLFNSFKKNKLELTKLIL